MAFKHKPQRYIYKLHSARLRKAKWNLKLTIDSAISNGEIIGISESTVLRWLDELNGETENDIRVEQINLELSKLKDTQDDKAKAKKLTQEKFNLLLKRDYMTVVMDSKRIMRSLLRTDSR